MVCRSSLGWLLSALFEFRGRGCRQQVTLLLLRQKKVTKEKATLVAASPALRYGATCGAQLRRGQKQLAALRQVFALIRLSLRSSAHTQGLEVLTQIPKRKPINKDTPRRVLVSFDRFLCCFAGFSTPCGCAEERRARRIRDRTCLSRRRVCARPRLDRAPQVARSEAKGRSNQGRLSFAYFSLAKQRKVSRIPGDSRSRNPKQARSTNNKNDSTSSASTKNPQPHSHSVQKKAAQ